MGEVKRTALAALIDDTRERNQWSDPDIARRATSRGHRLLKSNISDYRLRGMPTIVPAKIRALAAGLELPPYRVALAVLSDHGIDVPTDVRTPEDAIHHDHTLSAHARRSLLLLIEQDRAED